MNEFISRTNTPEKGQHELIFRTDSTANAAEIQSAMRRVIDRNRDEDYEEDKNREDIDVFASLNDIIKEFRSVLRNPEKLWLDDVKGHKAEQVLNWLLELRQYRKSGLDVKQIEMLTEAVQDVAGDYHATKEYIIGCLLRSSQSEALNIMLERTTNELEEAWKESNRFRNLLRECLKREPTITREVMYKEMKELLDIPEKTTTDMYGISNKLLEKDAVSIVKEYLEGLQSSSVDEENIDSEGSDGSNESAVD